MNGMQHGQHSNTAAVAPPGARGAAAANRLQLDAQQPVGPAMACRSLAHPLQRPRPTHKN